MHAKKKRRKGRSERCSAGKMEGKMGRRAAIFPSLCPIVKGVRITYIQRRQKLTHRQTQRQSMFVLFLVVKLVAYLLDICTEKVETLSK
mmetsp:Transcript_24592/g.48274  ORF Transcript_24592/g.48274 Transcript_24592/m.48274 type:complete len:89 (-) Transcript_24592:1283-1549(-)